MTSNKYRNSKGQFVKLGETISFKEPEEKLYNDYLEVEKQLPTVDLSDPETRQVIKDISRGSVVSYRAIHNRYYAAWIIGSAVGIFVSFWLGSLVYRP